MIIPNDRKFPIVEMKFTAPRIELAPAKCSEKIAKSTEAPAWAILLERGGYTVQPVPAPLSTKDLDRSITNAGNKSQKLILFIRGNAISAAPSINCDDKFQPLSLLSSKLAKRLDDTVHELNRKSL